MAQWCRTRREKIMRTCSNASARQEQGSCHFGIPGSTTSCAAASTTEGGRRRWRRPRTAALSASKKLVDRHRQRADALAGRVEDRVGDGRSGADDADLAEALDAERRDLGV